MLERAKAIYAEAVGLADEVLGPGKHKECYSPVFHDAENVHNFLYKASTIFEACSRRIRENEARDSAGFARLSKLVPEYFAVNGDYLQSIRMREREGISDDGHVRTLSYYQIAQSPNSYFVILCTNKEINYGEDYDNLSETVFQSEDPQAVVEFVLEALQKDIPEALGGQT